MKKIKVIIADQHPIMVSGLLSLLKDYPDVYDDPKGFTDINSVIKECKRNNVDVIILGEFSGNLVGANFVRWVKKNTKNSSIIAYTEKMPFIGSTELNEAGANGCVWKTSHPAKLIRAINSVVNGHTYYDTVHDDFKKLIERSSTQNHLTIREKQILQLIVDGKTNKEIARNLTVSSKTIESHRLNLMKKLDVHNGIELLKKALRMGACTI